MKIVPAILEKDFDEIESKLAFLNFVKRKYDLAFDRVQIDLCDGLFVDNITWLPGDNNDKEKETLLDYKNLDIEYHLMCQDQYKYFEYVKSIGASRVVIHIDDIFGTDELDNIIDRAREYMIKLVVTSRMDFIIKNRDELVRFLDENRDIDLQIMGIDKIGIQGQEFDDRVLELIKFFRSNFGESELSIQIDGSINNITIDEVEKCGADIVIVGSYLIKILDEIDFVNKFKSLYDNN